MPTIKTKATVTDPMEFINQLEDPQKKADSLELIKLMTKITGYKPVLWSANQIGFGTYYYKTKSKMEGKFYITGFSPRKSNMTIYILPGFSHYPELMKDLGKYKNSVGCLYFKKLSDLNIDNLSKLIEKSVEKMKEMYEVVEE